MKAVTSAIQHRTTKLLFLIFCFYIAAINFYEVWTIRKQHHGTVHQAQALRQAQEARALAQTQKKLDQSLEYIRVRNEGVTVPYLGGDKLRVAVCACTKSVSPGEGGDDREGWTDVKDSQAYSVLLASMNRTITQEDRDKYDIHLYLAADDDDELWRKLEASFVELVPDWITLHFNFVHSRPGYIPFNQMMQQVYDDGVDYMMRTNDDSEFASDNWITPAIEKLQSFDPPNVGAVGPGIVRSRYPGMFLMEQDFVHRTHLDIFKTYYPPIFKNWFIDTWITDVYGEDRRDFMFDWKIKHEHAARRYTADTVTESELPRTLKEGGHTIAAFMRNEYKRDEHYVDKEQKKKPKFAVCVCIKYSPRTGVGEVEKNELVGADGQTEFMQADIRKTLLSSFFGSLSKEEIDQYDFHLYLTADTDDQFWRDHREEMEQYVPREWLTLHFNFVTSSPNKVPVNGMMRQAYNDGMEYMLHLNEDMDFKTKSWLSRGVAALQGFNPPNVGVVQPQRVKKMPVGVELTHRTHLEIFAYYYPPQMQNVMTEQWMDSVYNANIGEPRVEYLSKWWVLHEHRVGVRFEADPHSEAILHAQTKRGEATLAAHLKEKHGIDAA